MIIQNHLHNVSDTTLFCVLYYSFLPTYVPDHGDEYGRHHLSDYLNRPDWYSQPRRVFVGASIAF